jgi:hypothetical protein
MTHAYDDTREKAEATYRRIHANGEQTFVHIISCGERYIVIAADVDPRNYEGVEGELIDYASTKRGAKDKARAWMEQHPKGIVGDSGGGSGRIMGFFKKLNDYGNSMAEQQDSETDNEVIE